MPATETLTIEYLPIDALRPDPYNPRTITAAEMHALTESIRKFGLVDPIIVRREDRTIIGGHQRLVAARRLGYTTVPVVEMDLSLEESRLLNIGLNKLGGAFDEELLARLLGDLRQAPSIDLALTGFDEDELQKLLMRLNVRTSETAPKAST